MAEYYQLRKDASPILLTKFAFFSAYQKNSANGGKNPKLISFFNKTPPSRQATRTNLFLLFFLVTCLTGLPPGMMLGSPASPPPPPPPLPPASTTPPNTAQRMETSARSRLLGEGLPILWRQPPHCHRRHNRRRLISKVQHQHHGRRAERAGRY